jgi:predicted acetyltransferase
MTGLIAEITGRGYPVSALFPATVPLYRSLGWEFAGANYETTVPIAALAELIGPDQLLTDPQAPGAPGLRRAVAADAAVIVETLGRVYQARSDSGAAVHEPAAVASWLDDEDHFAYLAHDGFLSYRWSRDTDSIMVQLLAAASPPTARAFWQIVASHGTMVSAVRARLAPDDPVSWLTREPAAVTAQYESWMLRLIDAAAAVAARGFPAAVTLSVQLEIADEALPANCGRWQLEISGGTGKLAPAAAAGQGATVRLGARGLAALYGGVPLSTLRGAGLAGGDQAADDALDSAFGGRPAFMLHEF